MAFYGSSFIFDGISSDQFGLYLVTFNGTGQAAGNIGGSLEIHEDRINRRSTGLHYGVTANEPLSFPVVFTVTEDNTYLDRFDVAAVAGWLTGHSQYKPLIICQPDMEGIFYRCLIKELTACEVGGKTVGFNGTVLCDGPYAYRSWPSTQYEFSGASEEIRYRNMSNVNDYYRPVIDLVSSASDISIENKTDGTKFTLSGLPAGEREIHIDCDHMVMTSSDGINLYRYWNMDSEKHFPRMARGDNYITISGVDQLVIKNEFPWNIGN